METLLAQLADSVSHARSLEELARPLLVKPNRSELAATLGVEIPDDAMLKERSK